MNHILMIVLVMATLAGCHKKIRFVPPLGPAWEVHEGWAAREVDPNRFLIYALDSAAEREAKETICTRAYVCTVLPAGRMLGLQRSRK